MSGTGAHLSRRSFLVAGGIGMAAVALSPSVAHAAAVALPAPSGTTGDELRATCFSSDWGTRYDVPFPATVSLTSPPEVGDVVIEYRWDPRLFAVDIAGFVMRDAQFEAATVTDSAEGYLAVTAPVGTTAVYVQPRRVVLYPAENVGDPIDTSVVLRGSGGVTALDASASQSGAAPWGIELLAEWAASAGYSYPSYVDVVSVGPNPVPVGVTVIARVYQAVESLVPDADSDQVEASGVAQPTQSVDYSFSVVQEIAAGGTARFALTPPDGEINTSRTTLTQLGQVFATVPNAMRADARATGKYSIAPVTPSGTELTDFSVPRKA